jgi:hypothetical protein
MLGTSGEKRPRLWNLVFWDKCILQVSFIMQQIHRIHKSAYMN